MKRLYAIPLLLVTIGGFGVIGIRMISLSGALQPTRSTTGQQSSLPLLSTTTKCTKAPSAPSGLKLAPASSSPATAYSSGAYGAGNYGGQATTSPNPTATTVALQWTAAKPASGCTLSGYYVYRNSTKVAATADTNYTDQGLKAATKYTYYIKAYDTSGHISSASSKLTVTTARQ